MITRDTHAFLDFAHATAPDFGPATARAAFLVAPDGFALAEQSAADNRYMADAAAFDASRASAQHRELQRALSQVLPTVCFAGDPLTPDALFPNNVFATAAGRYVVGRMRHPVRQREATRADIRNFFGGVLDYAEIDLSTQPHPCELTGALVIDRARGLGFAGLSERCDEAGARLMHEALGLRATLLFDLAPGEYHTNVVLAVLAGRAALICPNGFADPAAVAAIEALYAPHALLLSPDEHAAFAGNAISLSGDAVWMSAHAGRALRASSRAALAAAGFELRTVELDAIEAGGGSLRCCVGEIY
ncbi:arginine deiminase-related protein [Lysobacter koreensis]|uniref:Arginine deiminase-related protein n=1 Tax=Lysobacter koreensis TaxID=266122 RepID=A0ABW2YKH0_9GAMM